LKRDKFPLSNLKEAGVRRKTKVIKKRRRATKFYRRPRRNQKRPSIRVVRRRGEKNSQSLRESNKRGKGNRNVQRLTALGGRQVLAKRAKKILQKKTGKRKRGVKGREGIRKSKGLRTLYRPGKNLRGRVKDRRPGIEQKLLTD